MLSFTGSGYDVTRARRRGWQAVVALLAMGIVACSNDAAGPAAPGSILVRTETAGFLKAEGYGLVLDGTAGGTIGATDEVTISDLAPGSYQVGLGNMPSNCSAEAVWVSVVSGETAVVSLPVECRHGDVVTYTVQFNRERPDLDTGEITVCPFGICASQEHWDLYVHNNLQTNPQSVIRQNQTAGAEIAHLSGVGLAGLTEAHLEAATFTTQLVADPFDAGRVILIRSDVGNVYALANPTEDLANGRLTFQAALIARP
jgi:hypothetical protein